MSEIVCHDLAKLKDHLLFSEDARLVNKGTPTKAFKSMVIQAFGLDSGGRCVHQRRCCFSTKTTWRTTPSMQYLDACGGQQHCLFFGVNVESD